MDSERLTNFWLIVILAIPFALAAIIWIGMLYDILTTPGDAWLEAGHDRDFNLIVLFLLGPVGAILYGLAVRPQLARMMMKMAAREANRDGPGRLEPQPAA